MDGEFTRGQSDVTPEHLYLDLMKQCLTRYIAPERYRPVAPPATSLSGKVVRPVQKLLRGAGMVLARPVQFDPEVRKTGRDWPSEAETMIGLDRLSNIEKCVIDVLRNGVPGDLIEAGVWRGGAAIFMRAILAAYRDSTRCVWVADSFEGLPKPNADLYPQDKGDPHWTMTEQLGVSLEEVQANFARYGLLDDQVRFLKGWFRDTLPGLPAAQLAVMRLDGDMYESTMDALRALYPRLSVGGYVIVDDYFHLDACRAAVTDYRAEHGIQDPVQQADWNAAFWKRSA